MPFGKRENSLGKLDAKDLDEIFTLFRNILIPLIGMSTITDIFERMQKDVVGSSLSEILLTRAESLGA